MGAASLFELRRFSKKVGCPEVAMVLKAIPNGSKEFRGSRNS